MRYFLLFLCLFTSLNAWVGDVYDENGQITEIKKTDLNYQAFSRDVRTVKGRNFYRAFGLFETKNLKLVPITPNHEEAFFDLLNGEDTAIHAFDGKPKDKEDFEWVFRERVNEWDDSPFSWWTVYEKESGDLVGMLGLRHNEADEELQISCVFNQAFAEKDYLFEMIDKGLMGYFEKFHEFLLRKIKWSFGFVNDETREVAEAFLQRLSRGKDIRDDDRFSGAIYSANYSSDLGYVQRLVIRFDLQKLLSVRAAER